MKTDELEYFCTPPDAEADIGYTKILGGVQKY